MMFSLSNGWAKFYQVDHHRKHDEMKREFQARNLRSTRPHACVSNNKLSAGSLTG